MASGTGRVSIADVRHDWFVVDAAGQVLGRLATPVARVLSGKHRRELRAATSTRATSSS